MTGTFTPGSIVVGTDGSLLGSAAVGWAAHRAQARNLPLHIVHAFSPDTPMRTFGSGPSDEGEQIVAKALSHARSVAPGITVTTQIASGYASRSLIALSSQATMVVIGAHGHGPFTRGGLGAMALQVLAHAHCPVAIVPHIEHEPYEPHGKVLVGFDGSRHSLRALKEALLVATARKADLEVVRVWQPSGPQDPTLDKGSDWDQYERELEAEIADHLRRIHAEHTVNVNIEVLRGSPRKVLVERAKQADLLIVGARGGDGFPGLRLGMVAMGVAGAAPCPVLVVREHLAAA